jgi:hypothetical protein
MLLLCAEAALAKDEAPAMAETARDPRAMEILLRMARHLAKLQTLGVTVLSSYDAVQGEGEHIEFGEKRRIELQRPDRLRVDFERSDGNRSLLLFDGKQLFAFKPADNVYAVMDKPGTTDTIMASLAQELRVQMPLVRLFMTTLPENLEEQVSAITYVETNRLFDVPTDHLAARGTEVDFQLWIAQGDAPFPRRIIITYKNVPGQPQLRANFSDWNVTATPLAGQFAFTPPTGAEKVPFIIPARGPKPATPAKGGAQ